MRKIVPLVLDDYRRPHPLMGRSPSGELWGYFEMPSGMRIISGGERDASLGLAGLWEHVSCSFPDRCPTWDEMSEVKSLFWADSECVVQFHPPKADHVNFHPFTLHLWKPPYSVELPPSETIAPTEGQAK